MKNKISEITKILDHIRVLRKQKKITQEKVAKIIGVERSTYVRKESGAIPITLVEFIKIAGFLEMNHDSLGGKTAQQVVLPDDIQKLVSMIDSVSKKDRQYIIETTSNLVKHTKNVR